MTRPVSRIALSALVAWASVGAAVAESVTYTLPEDTARLRPGPGMDVAEAHCQTCHSSDYIAMQPGRKGHAFWSSEVTKMIKVYGAPIDEADAKTITDYLAATY